MYNWPVSSWSLSHGLQATEVNAGQLVQPPPVSPTPGSVIQLLPSSGGCQHDPAGPTSIPPRTGRRPPADAVALCTESAARTTEGSAAAIRRKTSMGTGSTYTLRPTIRDRGHFLTPPATEVKIDMLGLRRRNSRNFLPEWLEFAAPD
jgi:hypothetical protein